MKSKFDQIVILSCHPRNDGRLQKFLHYAEQEFVKVCHVRIEQSRSMKELKGTVPAYCIELEGYQPGKISRRFRWLMLYYRECVVDAVKSAKINADKPLIIHVHDPLLLPFGCQLKQNFSMSRLVYDRHEWANLSQKSVGSLERVWLEKYFAPCVDGLALVVSAMKDEVLKRFSRVPMVVVGNYPSLDTGGEVIIRNKIMSFSTSGPIRVVYFGSMAAEDRDMSLSLDIMEHLLRRNSRVLVRLGGRGADASILQRIADMERCFGNRFCFFGEVEYDTIVSETQQAHVGFLLHTDEAMRRYAETAPNKLFEYWAWGVMPVIKASVPLLKEKSEFAVRVVSGMPVQTIVESVENVYGNASLLEEIWEYGRTLSWEHETERYSDLYAELWDLEWDGKGSA